MLTAKIARASTFEKMFIGNLSNFTPAEELYNIHMNQKKIDISKNDKCE